MPYVTRLPSLSYEKVIKALQRHGWVIGHRNFQKCLFDLGLEGGMENEIAFNDDGTLKYQ